MPLPPNVSAELQRDMAEQLPNIKQQIAIHKPQASEIEIEHLFIRLNNREPNVNSEYFAIDRQGVYGHPPLRLRFDVLGVCWPRAHRQTLRKLDLCVMEVKLNMGGGSANSRISLSNIIVCLQAISRGLLRMPRRCCGTRSTWA